MPEDRLGALEDAALVREVTAGSESALATLYDLSVDVAVNRYLSITGYYSHAVGKDVIRAIYPAGRDGRTGR